MSAPGLEGRPMKMENARISISGFLAAPMFIHEIMIPLEVIDQFLGGNGFDLVKILWHRIPFLLYYILLKGKYHRHIIFPISILIYLEIIHFFHVIILMTDSSNFTPQRIGEYFLSGIVLFCECITLYKERELSQLNKIGHGPERRHNRANP